MRLILILFLMALLPSPELRRASGVHEPSLGVSSLAHPGLTFPGAAAAEAARPSRGRWPGPFAVDVIKVLDGDTVEVRFRDGPCGRGPCPGQEVNLRILDVDAPEAHRCRTRGARSSGGRSCAACDAEHRLGRDALAFTRDLVQGRAARVSAARPDKYGGRIVGRLEVLKDGRWIGVGDELLKAGLAVPYGGGRKVKPWCAKEPR